MRAVRTERLDLVPATPALLEAELRGHQTLAEFLGAAVPASWPPEFYDRKATEYTLERLAEGPEQAGWWMYYVVLREAVTSRTLVGGGGYKGPPDRQGTVEIGYSILAEYRRRGLATEASRGLIERAFADPRVERVAAETLPHLLASIGVLERLGFALVTGAAEEGVVRYTLERPTAVR